jgi:hypothetical protein
MSREDLTNQKDKQRTNLQNRSLHLYCQQLADTLNEAGIGQQVLLQGLEIDNSAESIKSLFRSLGRSKYAKNSTSELTTKEMSGIYDEITRHLSFLGIYVAWPTNEPPL